MKRNSQQDGAKSSQERDITPLALFTGHRKRREVNCRDEPRQIPGSVPVAGVEARIDYLDASGNRYADAGEQHFRYTLPSLVWLGMTRDEELATGSAH
ncbi:hypothetical protein PG990_002694 [Apiospora arundinis]